MKKIEEIFINTIYYKDKNKQTILGVANEKINDFINCNEGNISNNINKNLKIAVKNKFKKHKEKGMYLEFNVYYNNGKPYELNLNLNK